VKSEWATASHMLETMLSRLATIPAPTHLVIARKAVEEKYGSGMSDLVTTDRLARVIDRLKADRRVELGRSDRYVLAHAVASPSERLQGRSVLASDELYAVPLQAWERDAKAGKMRGSHWRGLFHSFLQAAPGAGTECLRKLLQTSWPTVQTQVKREMPWMAALGRHAGLLAARPCEPYIEELVLGKRELLDDLQASVGVPAASWFWPELSNALLAAIESAAEAEFKARIPAFLKLAVEFPGSPDAILATTLNRYARCEARLPHQGLLRFALDVWKSPQLSRNVLWSQVSPQAKQMVCGWLAQEDLEDFYRLCQDAGHVDERRLRYWLRFKEQIVFSQIVLGAELLGSKSLDIREFRQRKKGRLASLTSSTGGNNAIVMQIANWVFAEFSQTGNACYPYLIDQVPFALGESQYSTSDLKDRDAVAASGGETLIHRGQWERDLFDAFLRRCGIYPDASSMTVAPDRVGGTPGGSSAPRAPDRIMQDPRRDGLPLSVPHPLTPPLVSELEQSGCRIVDHRTNGGSLWVLGSGFDDKTYKALKSLGFKAKEGKGLYL
jgi:hypothetical protein